MSILYTCLVGISIPLKKIYNLQGAASALFFRDTARQAVALLMFRDMVMRPRKGYFSVLFVERTAFAVITWRISSEQQPQTRTQKKKRWGPALGLWQGLVALARAKLRKQQLKIRSHTEKQDYQPQHRTHIAKCKAQSRNPNSRMQKKKQQTHYPTQQTKPLESIKPACGVLTDNIAERR